MKTIEIEVALMSELNFVKKLIVPNVSWGMVLGGKCLHECDLLILTSSGYATEIEIKISKWGLIKDFEKKHNHNHNHIKNFYFAVPEKIKNFALQEIPEKVGLYIVEKKDNDYIVKKIKKCVPRKNAIKWTEAEMFKLAKLGTMRICGLKEKLIKKL